MGGEGAALGREKTSLLPKDACLWWIDGRATVLLPDEITLRLSGDLSKSSRERAVDLRSAEEYLALKDGLEVRRDRKEALDLKEVLFP